MKKIAFSIMGWLYVLVSSIFAWLIAMVIWLFTFLFDKQMRILHKFTCFWAFHYIQIVYGWQSNIRGRSNIKNNEKYIFAANHQSMIDILIIFGVKKHFKWVSKRSVFFLPFIGWNMRLNNYVGIRRGTMQAMKRMMQDCGNHLSQGSSVFFFPEGTRSKDGSLARFKAGPFKLAVENNTAIIPVVIDGTRDVLEKSSWILPIGKKVDIIVDILEPVDPSAVAGDVKKLQELVHQKISARLLEIRNTT